MPGTAKEGAPGDSGRCLCGDARVASECIEDCFPKEYDVVSAADYMRSMSEEIEEIKIRTGIFGPNVLKLCKLADIVFLALHGADGEGGTVQAAFDLLRIPYTGSGHLGSAMAMDKNISRRLFQAYGVPTASGIALKKENPRLAAAENGVGLPCIVKPCCGGSSVGVSIANNEEEFRAAVEEAFRY